MPAITVHLSDEMGLFAESYAKQKGFESTGEFISAPVSEFKERQMRQELGLLAGLESGATVAKSKEDWRQLRARVASQGTH